MDKRPVALIIAGLVMVALCIYLGVLAVYSLSRPAVSCSSVARKTSSTPPAELVTAQDYLAQGDYDYDRGDCTKAITDLTHAIELNPNFAEAYNNRAYVNMVKKDYAAALPDLEHAIQLRPDYVNARMNRGDIYNYYYAIDYARAVADYDRVLEIDPNAPNYSSVCGHRLLAINHGWSLNVLRELLLHGVRAGCP